MSPEMVCKGCGRRFDTDDEGFIEYLSWAQGSAADRTLADGGAFCSDECLFGYLSERVSVPVETFRVGGSD